MLFYSSKRGAPLFEDEKKPAEAGSYFQVRDVGEG